jgi:hypothetical protein
MAYTIGGRVIGMASAVSLLDSRVEFGGNGKNLRVKIANGEIVNLCACFYFLVDFTGEFDDFGSDQLIGHV